MCSIIAGLSALLTVASGVASYQAQKQQAESQAAVLKAQAAATRQQAAAQAAAYQAQAKNQQNQAKLDAYNAQVEARKQETIADNYAREEKELRDRRRIIAAQQRAQTGATGLDFSGSALDILAAGDEAYMQDQMTLLSNQRNENFESRLTQYNYNLNKLTNEVAARNSLMSADYTQKSGAAQAESLMSQADNVRSQARQAGVATILGTATSLVGGVMSAAGGGSSSSSSSYSAGSVSTDMGHGTTATYTPSSGYSFSSKTTWGNTTPRTYFAYNTGNSAYRTGNYF